MKKLLLATAISIIAMSAPALANHQSELDYDHVNVKFGQTEFGKSGDLETASLSFSKTVHHAIYITGSYEYAEHEDFKEVESQSLELKVGHYYDLHLAVPADLFIEAGFHRVNLDSEHSYDDQGLSLEIGMKSDLGFDDLNFSASIGGRDFAEMDEENGFFKTEMFYEVTDNLSFGLAYEYQNRFMGEHDVNSLEAGLRFSF